MWGGDNDDLWSNIFSDFDNETQSKNEFEYWMQKDSIIFLIDCSSNMFLQNANGEIPFQNAVKCAISTLSDKIISSDSDLIGVCLYGLRETNNLNDFANIFIFQDLDVPSAQKIIELERLLMCHFESEFGFIDFEFPFGDALWTCSTMFSNCTTKVGHKRIFLFTNDDNPNGNDMQLRNKALQRATDLTELGIDIELFSMNKLNEIFDPSNFYFDILELDGYNYDANSKFEELKSRVRKKEFKKRSLVSVAIKFGDVEIAVKGYNLTQKCKKSTAIPLYRLTNKPLKKIRKVVCEDTGNILSDYEILYSYTYGGENLYFEKKEIENIKFVSTPEIRLLGFKPRSALKEYQNLKNSIFFYPDDYSIQGSSVACAALIQKMAELDKIAITVYTARSNSVPKFMALLPQIEVIDEDNIQIEPSGFHGVYLPYADDIRDISDGEEMKKADEEDIDLAKRIIKRLTIDFDPRNFENTELQRHYANLQAFALDRDAAHDVEDYLIPDVEGMKRYEDLISGFQEKIFGSEYSPEAALAVKKKSAPAKKRKRDEDGDEGPVKKKKRVIKDIDWATITEEELKKLTADELKDYYRDNKIKGFSKLKKSELIDGILSARK